MPDSTARAPRAPTAGVGPETRTIRIPQRPPLVQLLIAGIVLAATGASIGAAATGQVDSTGGGLSHPAAGDRPEQVRVDPSIRMIQTYRNPPVIDTIIVLGNRVTKEFVILAEMELQPGDSATAGAMRRDRERLESIGLFSHAELKTGSMSGGRTALIVEVTELWYIWPGLYFAVDENDPRRTSIGAIISHNNFRGRRELLSVSGRYGYITGYEFDWKIPYLSRNSHLWSLGITGSYLDEDEPKYLSDREGVESRQRSLGAEVGYRFNLEDDMRLNLHVTSRGFSYDDGQPLRLTVSSTGRDILGGFELGAKHDTRTYVSWPDNAYVVRFALGGGLGLNERTISYLKPLAAIAGYYLPVPRVHLAGRVRASSYLGNSPPYEHVLLDRENGIRTAMNSVFTGTWRLLSSAELRGDILPIRYVTIDTFEPIQRYTRNLKFGISAALFTDYGVVGGDEDTISYADEWQGAGWDLSYGAGLIVHIPYRDVIRLELMRSARFPSDGLLVRLRLGSFF
ncbi:MAG: Outer membrane protein assembly factor BamA [Calditrichaeota bacterium]|nr:Outer membrane protein assembly factor BamA [Calditrichota bacterium]